MTIIIFSDPCCTSITTYITLQFVGLLCMLDIELFGVTGVVVELVSIGEVTSLSLALFGVQELRLIWADVVVGMFLLGLTFVF